MLSCVHGTIFGVPVVPPVNMIMASSSRSPSGVDASCVGPDPASRWTAGAPVAADGHGERPPPQARLPLSLGVFGADAVDEHHPRARRLGSGALLADGQRRVQRDHDQPARDAASKATTNSALLAARNATRSPASRPPRLSCPARSSTSRTKSR